MKIVIVNDANLWEAAHIHSEAWKQSHKAFCSAEFVEAHTPERQKEYLKKEICVGKRIWMLIDKDPVGIVSVWEDRIENLYVLPEKQRCGYGSALLAHAIEQCEGNPSLSVLNINEGAQKLYERAGFVETGSIKRLSDSLWEIEMALEQR